MSTPQTNITTGCVRQSLKLARPAVTASVSRSSSMGMAITLNAKINPGKEAAHRQVGHDEVEVLRVQQLLDGASKVRHALEADCKHHEGRATQSISSTKSTAPKMAIWPMRGIQAPMASSSVGMPPRSRRRLTLIDAEAQKGPSSRKPGAQGEGVKAAHA